MKKSILNIGKALNKSEQKEVFGGARGFAPPCSNPSGNPCNPANNSWTNNNPACELGEVCVSSNNVTGTCQCD